MLPSELEALVERSLLWGQLADTRTGLPQKKQGLCTTETEGEGQSLVLWSRLAQRVFLFTFEPLDLASSVQSCDNAYSLASSPNDTASVELAVKKTLPPDVRRATTFIILASLHAFSHSCCECAFGEQDLHVCTRSSYVTRSEVPFLHSDPTPGEANSLVKCVLAALAQVETHVEPGIVDVPVTC